MTSQRKAAVILVPLTATIAATFLTSSATAQNPRATTAVDAARLITTSAAVTVGAGTTFDHGKVEVPVCPKTTMFLVTHLHANPSPNESAADLLSLAKWQASVHVAQLFSNGSFSPQLTVFGQGPQHASASIPGGQPIGSDDN